MAKREREAADMGAMVDRVLESLTRRAVDGDVEALVQLVRVEGVARTCAVGAANMLKRDPWNYSWSDLGEALGVTRQAAQQRFGLPAEPARG